VIGVLDRCSDRPGVVTALRERTPTPPGQREHLVPHTDESTLASLSGTIELLLCDGEVDRAPRGTENGASMHIRPVLGRVGLTAAASSNSFSPAHG
jgi:hypothetical protein